MTPENQPEMGIAKKAYGMIKGAGHSFKRATLGDIYTLIETRADEARQHREENFRYLNTRIDTQIGDVRQEIGLVRQEIGTVRQEIGAVRQEIGAVNHRIDTLGQKVDDQIKEVRQEIKEVRQEIGSVRQELSNRLDTITSIMQVLVDLSKQKS
jgi:uncharacterized coiled-coil DUF342 family protein